MIVADFYVLPTSQIQEKPMLQALETSRTSITSGYSSFTVTTEKGNKYNLPDALDGRLNYDSVFFISKTFLLRCPAVIFFENKGEQYSMKIGHFNSNIIIQGILIAVLVMSTIGLAKKDISPDTGKKFFLVYVIFYCLFIAVVWIV
jgi:hypothetical protein